MIRLAVSNTPQDAAWAAFDDAALRLNRMYRAAEQGADTTEARARRALLSVEVVRLWDAWRALFLDGGGRIAEPVDPIAAMPTAFQPAHQVGARADG